MFACKQCSRCGKPGLHWEIGPISQKWMLFEADGRKHVCETVANRFDRNGLYAAVDAMSAHELRELGGYAAQRLMELEEKPDEHQSN